MDLWGAAAIFALTDYEDSQSKKLQLIKDWKDLVNQVGALEFSSIKLKVFMVLSSLESTKNTLCFVIIRIL